MAGAPFSTDTLANLTHGDKATGTGRFAASPVVLAALRSAAQATGAPFESLATTAAIESGMNPGAKASTSSATGLFQFTDQTWLATVKRAGAELGLGAQAAAIVRGDGGQYTVADPKMRQDILDLRKDPKVSAAMAGDHLKETAAVLTQTLGHPPDVTETYMAHFLGTGGATQMLQALKESPNRAASDVLPEAARANPAMFSGKTVAQFVGKVQARVEQTYAALGMAMPKGSLNFANGSGTTGSGGTAENGSDGWSKGAPVKLSTAQERIMLASLARVFTEMDRKGGAGHHHASKTAQASVPAGTMPGAGSTPLGG